LRVDFLPAVLKRIVHRTMIRNGNFGCHFRRIVTGRTSERNLA
jgi:hypothetical protein